MRKRASVIYATKPAFTYIKCASSASYLDIRLSTHKGAEGQIYFAPAIMRGMRMRATRPLKSRATCHEADQDGQPLVQNPLVCQDILIRNPKERASRYEEGQKH